MNADPQIHIRKPTGAGVAAMLAAAFGIFVIGLATVLAEMSEAVGSRLNWWDPVGPLVGKTGVGVLGWLVSWVLFHSWYRSRDVDIGRHLIWVGALLLLGGLGTFPPFFTLFRR